MKNDGLIPNPTPVDHSRQDHLQHLHPLNKTSLLWLFAGVCLLTAVNIPLIFVQDRSGLIYVYFSMDFDRNIPAWFSSMLLALAGLVAFECSLVAGRFGQWSKSVFLLLSLLLVFMSCDEIARFHETLPEILSDYLGLDNVSRFEAHPWILLGGPFVIILLITMFLLLNNTLKRFPKSRSLMLWGFIILVTGGIVLESIMEFLPRGILWQIEMLLEETLEMVGTLLISASLILWRDQALAEDQPNKPPD
ncbi:MAG: hypothetical protein P1V21_08850 [Rhizobiaceae bacterium]|nr:hypothetical protein [Rhizobiaceae bacterium]